MLSDAQVPIVLLRDASHFDVALLCAGYYATGFLTYEAASAFNEAFTTCAPGNLPLVWFGVFNAPQKLSVLPDASGDTYQVNYATRFRADFQGEPYAFFLQLNRAQTASFSAYFDTGRDVFFSGSQFIFARKINCEFVGRAR